MSLRFPALDRRTTKPLSSSRIDSTAETIYEAEYATLNGARTDYTRKKVSGPGHTTIKKDQSATFWVYSPDGGESTLSLDTLGGGRAWLDVNGHRLTGQSGTLRTTWYEAETARLAGTAQVTTYPLAGGGKAVSDIGGAPGNGNTLSFDIIAPKKGASAMTVRYSNPEQSPASHYNPDPLARHAEISVNGAPPQRAWFPRTFHGGNFWELTIPVQLRKGANTVSFASQELPDFDRDTYISDTFPGILLRSTYAPIVDKIALTPLAR